MSFGPSPVSWWGGPNRGKEETKIEVLAELGQANLTEMQLRQLEEKHQGEDLPLERPSGERCGTVSNIHYSDDRRGLVAEITCSYPYKDTDLNTQLSTDRGHIDRIVLAIDWGSNEP